MFMPQPKFGGIPPKVHIHTMSYHARYTLMNARGSCLMFMPLLNWVEFRPRYTHIQCLIMQSIPYCMQRGSCSMFMPRTKLGGILHKVHTHTRPYHARGSCSMFMPRTKLGGIPPKVRTHTMSYHAKYTLLHANHNLCASKVNKAGANTKSAYIDTMNVYML
jgi:hypothetical protein